MGASASGAKNVECWENCLDSDRVPLPSSLTYEGVYNEHFFVTGYESKAAFSVSVSSAVSKDPINGEWDTFISLGLNSVYDGDGLARLGGRYSMNMVFLLDTSGSMAASLESSPKTKLFLAVESLKILISKLKSDDMFSLVTFDSTAKVLIPLTKMSDMDKNTILPILDAITARGSTDLSAGLRCAYQQFAGDGLELVGKSNRVIVLTDDNTNTGDTSAGSLVDIVSSAADKHEIFTTTIGIGIDFQTDLAKELGAIKACNYLSVKDAHSFQRTMDSDFDYLVSPIAFDVVVAVDSDHWRVDRVYGSPGFESPGAGGEVVRMNSVMPSQKQCKDSTKGGVVLLQLKPKAATGNTSVRAGGPPAADSAAVRLTVSYEDRDGIVHMDTAVATVPAAPLDRADDGRFGGTAVRKAVALTRYVNVLKRWAAWEIATHHGRDGISHISNDRDSISHGRDGITSAGGCNGEMSEASCRNLEGEVLEAGTSPLPLAAADPARASWCGARVPLHVCEEWRRPLSLLADYLQRELAACHWHHDEDSEAPSLSTGTATADSAAGLVQRQLALPGGAATASDRATRTAEAAQLEGTGNVSTSRSQSCRDACSKDYCGESAAPDCKEVAYLRRLCTHTPADDLRGPRVSGPVHRDHSRHGERCPVQ